MRYLLLPVTFIVILTTFCRAQSDSRFVSQKYQHFYNWFHRQSQVEQLYSNQSTLYIFGHLAEVRDAPCLTSNVITELSVGQAVQNLAYREGLLPEDVINGYGDFWYHVRGKDQEGRSFNGYIWGGDIAKGWRRVDLTGDGYQEFVLLGVASRPRRQATEINAELRVLQNGQLRSQTYIPGLCVFEECATSPLLRVIESEQHPELRIIEASTMAIGCEVGIEKSFFTWDGGRLNRIFHAEYTTGKEFFNNDFSVQIKNTEGITTARKVCRFSHEDKQFNPVWECRVVPLEKQPELVPKKAKVKARAR